MTDLEIMTAVIRRVEKRGYTVYDSYNKEEMKKLSYLWPMLIVDHIFLQKFFGTDYVNLDISSSIYRDRMPSIEEAIEKNILSMKLSLPNWKFHAMQIILEEQPLKYLEKFL